MERCEHVNFGSRSDDDRRPFVHVTFDCDQHFHVNVYMFTRTPNVDWNDGVSTSHSQPLHARIQARDPIKV